MVESYVARTGESKRNRGEVIAWWSAGVTGAFPGHRIAARVCESRPRQRDWQRRPVLL